MKLPRFTVKDVISWKPCQDGSVDYSRKGIEKLFGRRKYGDALWVLSHPDIPDADKLWAVLRDKVIPERILHWLAVRYAKHILPIYEEKYPDDNRPRKAINTKKRWLKGTATDDELAAAGEAARAAAWAAAGEAAWEAARAAAWAAGAAARAAGEAARAAGAAAETKYQIAATKRLLTRYEKGEWTP